MGLQGAMIKVTVSPMSLDQYTAAWQLQFPKKFASTTSSDLYKVKFQDQDCALKIFSKVGAKDEVQGSYALEYFAGEGAVKIFRFDSGAQLMEFIDGENLLTFQRINDQKATRVICSIIKQFKISPPLPQELFPLARWFQSLFREGLGSDFQSAAKLAKELLESPLNTTVLHGDIHHENILRHPERGWLAIDPKGLLGEKTFDTANLFYNPGSPLQIYGCERIESVAEICSKELDIEMKRILSFAYVYGYLKAAWMIEDGIDPGPTLEIAQSIKTLLP